MVALRVRTGAGGSRAVTILAESRVPPGGATLRVALNCCGSRNVALLPGTVAMKREVRAPAAMMMDGDG